MSDIANSRLKSGEKAPTAACCTVGKCFSAGAGAAGVHRLESPRAHRGTPPILVVMGVSGAGKSTVAKELAARLGWPFEEGDWR
jgi:hypothetical protein